MKITLNKLKKLILSLTQDIVFDYKGKTCCINPWSENKIELGYGDILKVYTNIDELFNDIVFDGKTLKDIVNIIEVE